MGEFTDAGVIHHFQPGYEISEKVARAIAANTDYNVTMYKGEAYGHPITVFAVKTPDGYLINGKEMHDLEERFKKERPQSLSSL